MIPCIVTVELTSLEVSVTFGDTTSFSVSPTGSLSLSVFTVLFTGRLVSSAMFPASSVITSTVLFAISLSAVGIPSVGVLVVISSMGDEVVPAVEVVLFPTGTGPSSVMRESVNVTIQD